MSTDVKQEPTLLLVGTDFRCAPIELRELVSCSGEQAEHALVHLLARPGVTEAFLLSTCNRTEIYLQPQDEDEAYRTSLELIFLQKAPELEKPGRLYVKRNGEAAHHLLAVASGLESMVLGEPEILGQVKQQAALAEHVGSTGPVLRRLLRSALAAGARARQETAITTGAVSLGYAVVELARNIFSGLEECQVLIIGAGEIARSVARPLVERGARELLVANRSEERARQFKEELPQAQLLSFAERLDALRTADVVIATTGADEPVLTRKQLKEAMASRRGRKLLVVDLGVPRNVEAAASRLDNLFLHTIDSLDLLIQKNLKRRKEEVPRVEEILDQELERLTRSLVRKILHHPSTRLRARDGEDLSRLDLVRELFHLDDEES